MNVTSLPLRVTIILSAVTKLARLRSRNLIGEASSLFAIAAASTTTVVAPSVWAKCSPSGFIGSTGEPILSDFSTGLAALAEHFELDDRGRLVEPVLREVLAFHVGDAFGTQSAKLIG